MTKVWVFDQSLDTVCVAYPDVIPAVGDILAIGDFAFGVTSRTIDFIANDVVLVIESKHDDALRLAKAEAKRVGLWEEWGTNEQSIQGRQVLA